MKLNALLLLLFTYAFLTDVSARPSSSPSELSSSSLEEDTGILNKVKELPSLLSWIPIGSQQSSQTSTTPAPTVTTTSQPDSAPIEGNLKQIASIIQNAPWWFLGSTDHQETTSPTPKPTLPSKTSDTKARNDGTSVINVPLKNALPIDKRVPQPTTERLKLPDLWISNTTPKPDYQASELWPGAAESVRNILSILSPVEEISTPSPIRTTTERISRTPIVPKALKIEKSRQQKPEPTLAFSGVPGKVLSQTDLSSSAVQSRSAFSDKVPVEGSFSTQEQFEEDFDKSVISPATPMTPIDNSTEKSNVAPQLSLPNESIPEIPSLPSHHDTDVSENEQASSSTILPSNTANSDADLTIPVNKITDRESPENMNSLEQNDDTQPLIQPSVLQEQGVQIPKGEISRSSLFMNRPLPETDKISSPNFLGGNDSEQLSGIDKNSPVSSGPEEATTTPDMSMTESEDRIESSTSHPDQTVNIVGGSPRSGGKSRSLGSMPSEVEDSPLIEHEEPNENSKSSSTFDYDEAADQQEPEDISSPSIPLRTAGSSRSAIHAIPQEHMPLDTDSSDSLFTSNADVGGAMHEPEDMPPRSAGASRSAILAMPQEHNPPDIYSSHSEAHPQIETPEIMGHAIKHHIVNHPSKHHTVEHPTKHHIVHHHDKHHIARHHNEHSGILHGHHVKGHTHCVKKDLYKKLHTLNTHHSEHRTPQAHPIVTPYAEESVSLQQDSSLNAPPGGTILLLVPIPAPILPPFFYFGNN